MKRNCVQSISRRVFGNLGNKVAENPAWFTICPIFLTMFLATGLQRMKKQNEGASLLGKVSQLEKDRSFIEQMFPLKPNDYDPSRSTAMGRYGSVIITEKNEGSVLTKEVFDEVDRLDSLINNITVRCKEGLKCKNLNYLDLCVKEDGKCLRNRILTLGKKIEEFRKGWLNLTYPLNFSAEYNELSSSVMYLGGVEVDENSYIRSAKAIRLFYHLKHNGRRNNENARKWEELFSETLTDASFQNINVDIYTSHSIQKELDEKPLMGLYYFPGSLLLMILFSMLTSSSPDWHRSKPWIGVITMIATGMAIASGFGLVTYLGVLFFNMTTVVPFVILGVGMDDTFVMMSAWKRTDTQKSLEDRLRETYAEAGLSITITSLTNFISFVIGTFLTSFETLRAFCISMCACVCFDYLYQITFVGALLLLYGRCEKRGLHSLTFRPLGDRSELHSKVWRQQPNMITRISRRLFKNMWTKIGEGFTKWYIKLLVLITYAAYLLTSLWGCSKLIDDAEIKTLTFYNSYTERYLDAEYKYFYRYRSTIQIVINATIDYSDPNVQRNIEAMMNTFESDPLLAGSQMRVSWLKSYLRFLNDKRISNLLKYYNLTQKEDFIYILRKTFLNIPKAKIFKKDLVFNEAKSDIISSRFFCQTGTIRNDTDFKDKLSKFKKLLKEAPYPVVIYHPMFNYFDGLDVIRSATILTLCVISLTMALVCLIFLPDVISAFCVSCTALSVGVGIVGYMALWGIGLNPSSMCLLIAVSGLSIDYAAHISCAYFSLDDATPNECVKHSLSVTSMPIFQGSVTTVLCVSVFVKPISYSYMLASKVVFLVSSLAAIHALVFLPVIFSLLHISYSKLAICYKKVKKSAAVFKVNG